MKVTALFDTPIKQALLFCRMLYMPIRPLSSSFIESKPLSKSKATPITSPALKVKLTLDVVILLYLKYWVPSIHNPEPKPLPK